MSFYIRKSLKVGPLRFNLSKSGIGVSAGITGFRIGTGPRGNYVHMGRNGLYYRKTLPSSTKPSGSRSDALDKPRIVEKSAVEMEEIESVDVLKLQDSSSADLLAEMNNKHQKMKLWPIAAVLSVVLLFVFLILEFPVWVIVITALLAGIAVFFIHRRDKLAKTVVLFYDLDANAEKAYQALHNAFLELLNCAKSWHISTSGQVTNLHEWKRQAGASTLVKRQSHKLALQTPPFVSTNLSIPTIPVGRQTVYFFPDRLLVYEGNKVGAVSYSDMELDFSNSRFIETQGVPRDAKVVDHTWQYVNKSGGPDRRFKNNRKLPIALYSEIYFKSKSGLNELIQLSKPDIGDSLSVAIRELISVQTTS